MSSENLEIVQNEYRAGKAAFERGHYRESVEHLQKASALVAKNTRFGGEVQIWLVTAYEAADMRTEARNLCKQLEKHPSLDIRKQSSNLLYILEAPRLERRADWLTQIPDLGSMSESEAKYRRGAGVSATKRPPADAPDVEPDLTQVNVRDNLFIWVALIAVILTLGGLIWLS